MNFLKEYSFFRSNQAGDTIVEVVIAIAILSSILIGAFVVSNNSSRNVRDAQEHTQALELLQGQVELLRAAAYQPGTLTSINQPFCLSTSHGTSTTPTTISVNLASASVCQIASSSSANSYSYNLSIVAQSPIPSPSPVISTTLFKATVTWPALGGGQDQVFLFYRIAVQ